MKFVKEHALSESFNLSTITDYYELTKPGITFMVLASMLMGFILGSSQGIEYMALIHAIIGTYLIAAGTAAHNQFIERKLDKLMNRTSKRPLPDQRIPPQNAFLFSIGLILVGLVYLIMMVNFVAGLVSAATTLIYLGAYTPMKRVSSLNVWIGAIPGALPPVGGWAAATGHLSNPGMWILFAIVFFWQVPHVLAIAWLCNNDYSNAGFHMLPKNDTKGNKTSLLIMLCLLALIPVTYLLYAIHISGMIYLVGGMLSALGFLYYGIVFTKERTKDAAKKLMFASFIYLPLVWLFVFIDLLV